MTSVGIDIGTSTTKLIVSQLHVAPTTNPYSLPRYEIVDRLLQYVSPIFPTPLLNQQDIDLTVISKWIKQEYEGIKLKVKDIQTGAVIITGETANKNNARRVVHNLAEQAGGFVVAIAGADVEGMLAGKGSGAELRSLSVHGVVANIDIGGGTANASFFQRGRLIGTITFHVGGRLIRLNSKGCIWSISPAINFWLRERGYSLIKGEQISLQNLEVIVLAMCRDMVNCLKDRYLDAFSSLLIVGNKPLAQLPEIDEIMISGGIGAIMQNKCECGSIEKVAVYGDIGPLLACTLQRVLKESPFRLIIPDQTSRATVIGSGMQSMELSGSTVFISPHVLPLRNLPIVLLEWEDGERLEASKKQADRTLEQASRFYHLSASAKGHIPFAIAIKCSEIHSYVKLQRLAKALVEAYEKHIPNASAIVVICEHNIAKALGQALYLRSRRRQKIVCIDQIKVEQGDYMDIGEPLSGEVVPVIIKTLVFAAGMERS